MEPLPVSRFFDIFTQSQKIYSRQLEPVCKKWDLTRSEVDVLLFLFNNPSFDRAADIVTRRGMAKSQVSMSVVNLEERGLLVRQLSEADRRTAHLQLTEQGAQIAAEGRDAQIRFFSQIYQGIEEEELRRWGEISRKISRNIQALR